MSSRTQAKIDAYLTSTAAWLRLRDRQTGRIVAYGLPSESQPGLFHRCTPAQCDCRGFSWSGYCSHQRAAAQYVAVRRAEQLASTTMPVAA